ncbi:inositol-pentakisphosphate 2-kinase [Colletotrichum truncatum]|uniref:Inositol-pentakisphosphate 2-kinase n=1 Tax=Colletotrichum truncatum TaxID=5467 RepID=A0ACC3YJ77_COLTU|nr:inositol-pentakisphosphate 2-kinase [Colletotrichum truncatum]KAF6797160.1 inositol-pentakisphosphate 2-kinase [Colletotrichum truncatum]
MANSRGPIGVRPPHYLDRVFAEDVRHIGPLSHVQYVGEGAANVVFTTVLRSPGGRPNKRDGTEEDVISRYLLRVPKQPKNPDKPFFSAGVQFCYFREMVRPLFDNQKDLLVDHIMGRVSDDTIANMRNHLKALDVAPPMAPRRPAKFVGDTIYCTDNLVMLVEDMRPRDGQRTIEFKPKWLAQSPSAPGDANTCRCCALASKKYYDANNLESEDGSKVKAKSKVEDKGKAKDESKATADTKPKETKYSPDNYPCPLWLDPQRDTPSGKEAVRRKAIKRLFKNDEHHAHLYSLLKQLPTLSMLKQNQLNKDPYGPLRARIDDANFCMAMTLRDCSLFVRYCEGQDGKVVKESFEAKLADLDWKNAAWKFDDWQDKERALVEEGWYTGRGQMKNCALYR